MLTICWQRLLLVASLVMLQVRAGYDVCLDCMGVHKPLVTGYCDSSVHEKDCCCLARVNPARSLSQPAIHACGMRGSASPLSACTHSALETTV